jgi:hypothetical protein
MRRLIFVAIALVIVGWSSFTQAAEPHPRWAAPYARQPMPPYSKQAQIGAYGRAVYPKYYWGLHSREFYNVGVPHGDIGLRGGNGFTWNPW